MFNKELLFFVLVGTVPAHLSGRVSYGDNVEDEWFIVYLVFELSKRFTDIIIGYIYFMF